jgi:hypothetical protein
MWLCDEMIAQGREAYCVCPTLMDDAECQQQRDAFVNRIGSSTVDMFCTNLWSMLFWKALVRINFSTPANTDDYMEQAQYRKAGHVVSGKFVDFKSHVRFEYFPVIFALALNCSQRLCTSCLCRRKSSLLSFKSPRRLFDSIHCASAFGKPLHSSRCRSMTRTRSNGSWPLTRMATLGGAFDFGGVKIVYTNPCLYL